MALATATTAATATAMTLLVAVVVTVIVAVTAAATAVVMVVIVTVVMAMIVTAATGTVHVAVSQLFGGRGTHVLDLDLEAQGHTGQRMVAIHLDELFGDFDDGHRTVAIVGLSHESLPFRHFHAIEQLAGHFLHQVLVILAIGLARRQGDVERLAHTAAFQLGFEAGDPDNGYRADTPEALYRQWCR